MEDVHVMRAIQSACERMCYSTLKDEQFRIIADILSCRDILVCLPTGVMRVTLFTPFTPISQAWPQRLNRKIAAVSLQSARGQSQA